MQPPDSDIESLVCEWLDKAEADLEVARRMAGEAADNLRIRGIVAFHCQPAAEKCLKAFLTRFQIEFPRTHDIKSLLQLVRRVDIPVSDSLSDARWLTPFGVEIRYPGDAPEMLPGDEVKAIEIASRVRRVVLANLRPQ